MRFRFLLLGLSLALCLPALAQSEVDVTQLSADTKTFIFSDNKHTVKTYIYDELEGKTACCGSDRIYLEVKIDPSGYVLQAKTLTGKNECYKKSAMDIVKNIKWDAQGFKGPKSVYFEIKPEVECSEERNNTYTLIPLFHNELLDVNGLPLNHAQSTGISASKASGTVSAPLSTPAAEPPATASAEKPKAETPAATTTPQIASGQTIGEKPTPTGVPTPPPTKPATTSDAQLDEAMKLAQMKAKEQEAEIEKLKAELAAQKAAEEESKKEEEEAIRRAEEAKQREAIAERQRQKEEEDRRKREAEQAKTASRTDNRSQGFQDVNYDESPSGNDLYADNRSSGTRGGGDDQKPMTAEERAREEKLRMEQEKRELEDKMRQIEADSRRAEADRQRFAQDQLRLEERILRKEDEIQKERERAELERLDKERREAEDRRREQERQVQEAMDQLKRMQSDLDRKLADMQRQEEEMKRKEQEKIQREQQITAEQQQRQQRIESEIDRMKMQTGVGLSGTTAQGDFAPSTTSLAGLDSTGAMLVLVQEIRNLQSQIALLNNKVNTLTGTGYSSPSTTTRTSNQSTRQTPVSTSAPKTAAQDKSWNKVDYRDPDQKDSPIYSSYGQGQKPGSQSKTHENVTIPSAGVPTFKGGQKAMKSFIATELQKGGICGLAQAVFEVTVDGKGAVQSYRIIKSNDFNVEAQMMNILPKLGFEPSGSKIPQITIVEFKAEIICDGTERINIRNVEDIINK